MIGMWNVMNLAAALANCGAVQKVVIVKVKLFLCFN
jgi:hypothetical protein